MSSTQTVSQHPLWSNPLYQEIFLFDTYHLERLSFRPDTVYDIGANLGCFSARAKSLWPECNVVCLEPHPTNFANLLQLVAEMPDVLPINAAMATGPVHWRQAPGGETNPGGQSYISKTVGYDDDDLAQLPNADCQGITLAQLVAQHPPRGRYLVKIDTEGAEQCLFTDHASNEVLHRADFWTAELHFFAGHHQPYVGDQYLPVNLATHRPVINACLEWSYGFTDTHKVEMEIHAIGGMVWCTKKP